MAEELLTPHVLGQIRLTGKAVFWDTAQAEVICRMEELLQPGFFGERPQVDFFDAGAYRELPYLLAPLLARLTGRTVEVHIVKDGTGLTNTAKGGLREFASEHGAIWHIIEEKPEQCLWNTEVFLGALQADTANRGKDLPSADELQEEMDAQPQALLTYLIRSLRRRGLRFPKMQLVIHCKRSQFRMPMQSCLPDCRGKKNPLRITRRRLFAYRARIMNRCHCLDVITGGYEYVNGRLQKGV